MNVQYLSGNDGRVTAVQVSIEDWERLKVVHPDIDEINSPIPQWQKDLIDKRLKDIKEHPELLRPIEELYDFLDQEDN